MNTKQYKDITDDIIYKMINEGRYSNEVLNFSRKIYKTVYDNLSDIYTYEIGNEILEKYRPTINNGIYVAQRRCLKKIDTYVNGCDFINTKYNYQQPKEYNSYFKLIYDDYIIFLKDKLYSKEMLKAIIYYSNNFFDFLNYNENTKLSKKDVYDYITHIKSIMTLGSASVVTSHIKKFLQFLYLNNISEISAFDTIPKVIYYKNSTLINYFDNEEVREIINKIDRNSLYGKRDFAMILLAAVYGIRASDIVNLKIENILWEYDLIKFRQVKTKKELSLPLTKEVKLCLLDYYMNNYDAIKKEGYLFLKLQAPYTKITSSATMYIFKKYLKCTDIDISKHKGGFHTLRHSVANDLLKNNIPLPTIKEILGHSTIESTKVYLHINTNDLKKLSLEVPYE